MKLASRYTANFGRCSPFQRREESRFARYCAVSLRIVPLSTVRSEEFHIDLCLSTFHETFSPLRCTRLVGYELIHDQY